MYVDLNKILKIVINQAEKAGCEPNRINPEIKINDRASSFWGRCKWNPNEKWYDIELTKRLLSTDVYSITNTIAHEVLHACKGGNGHKGLWKTNAEKMNRLYGYNIQRCNTYETHGATMEYKYIIKCNVCGKEFRRRKLSKVVAHPGAYKCLCGGGLARIR